MATTTTNYGFDVPTSSDLVKNGATQIALLGQDLDTFLFRPFTRNGVLNSGFNVWQRSTSFTPGNSAYTADRWAYFGQSGSSFTVERVATADTTNLPFIQYAARVKRASGATSTNQQYLLQNFESVNSIPYAGKQVTYSFYARAGANYSAAAGALFAYIATGTGTDQNALAGYTGSATPISTTVTLTTTWQRFTITGSLAATTTELATAFIYTPTGTAGANDFFEVTGVQIEVGNQASPYAPSTPTYATELAACQRYYWQVTDTNAFKPMPIVTVQSATQAFCVVPHPIQMRANPTFGSSGNWAIQAGAVSSNVSSFTANEQGVQRSMFSCAVTGLVAGSSGRLYGNNDTSATFTFSAEL